MSDNPNRVGDVEIAHGAASVVIVLHGRWPGAAQLSPDDADLIAERIKVQAAYAREINAAVD